jgi:hypothetical protein
MNKEFTPVNISAARRYSKTLEFVKKHLAINEPILDLGIENNMSHIMKSNGYSVINTHGQNLDIDYSAVNDYSVITAFEIFEHMLAPFNLLNKAKGKLIASVPLKLWFAPAYWNNNDPWDCHYHEFEVNQFNILLERTGWNIIDTQFVKGYDKLLGFRPMLRRIYPRWYFVYAKK